MSEGHHSLVEMFPEHHERLHALKEDGHFARLAGDYHALAKELHAIEAGTETPSDAYIEELKKKRLAVLDEISAILHEG